MRSVVCLLFHSSPIETHKRKLISRKQPTASPMEWNQRVDEILRSSKMSFLQLYMNNRFLQPHEDGRLRRGCQYKMMLWNWPKRHDLFFYVLYSWRVAAIVVKPSLFLPSRVASKRAQGFSNKVDILEIIRHVCFQRQVCIWNKHMIIFPRINQRQRKFMYSIVLFYFI